MSSVDDASRIAIIELFARYCHRVDHDDGPGWAALFTDDGVFEVPGALRLEGVDQLRSMPGQVAQLGGGKWRHQVTNIAIDAGPDPDSASVVAYGVLSDWNDGGKLANFTDYQILMRRIDGGWRIARLVAVGL